MPAHQFDAFARAPSIAEPADRGQAALLLVESVIHGLIARGLLTVRDAVEIIEIAADVERDLALVSVNGAIPPRRPSLLTPMADSLRFDIKD